MAGTPSLGPGLAMGLQDLQTSIEGPAQPHFLLLLLDIFNHSSPKEKPIDIARMDVKELAKTW